MDPVIKYNHYRRRKSDQRLVARKLISVLLIFDLACLLLTKTV